MLTNKSRLRTADKWSMIRGSMTIITSDPMPGIDHIGQRRAKCFTCSLETWSNPALPEFKDLEEEGSILDQFYCGCMGFD